MAKHHLLILLLALLPGAFLHAQSTKPAQDMPEYKAAWKTIDSLENQGLPRSAFEKVEALYERAKKDKAHPQVVKAVIYRNKFLSQLEEEGTAKAIGRIEKEIQDADFPVRPVLHSILAELYKNYLERNQYRIQQRSETQDQVPEDITTWTIGQLSAAASQHYWRSLADKRTQEWDIESWDAIIQNEAAVDHNLRPTLYDFLAHRALDHFMDNRAYLNDPVYKFVLRDPQAFAAADTFAGLSFDTQDTSSFTLKTLLIFQELLTFRLSADNMPAQVDADLKRLQFVYNQSIVDQKDSLYLSALNGMMKQYESSEEAALLAYAKARLYMKWGNTYTPKQDTTHRWKLKEAADICQKAVTQYPKSYGAKQCINLLNQLSRSEAYLEVESINLPGEALLTSLRYRNVKQLHFRLLRVSALQRQAYESDNSRKVLTELKEKDAFRSWSFDLPDEGDMQEHAVELPIEALELGNYVLLFSENSRFREKQGQPEGLVYFAVSELGYLLSQDEGRILLAHRESGQPLEGVEAVYYRYEYNRRKQEREQKQIYRAQSDEDGFLSTPPEAQYANFAHLTKGDDELILRNVPTVYRSWENTEGRNRTLFFLDRSIYRPGQAVYFKVLTLTIDDKEVPSILPNQAVTVAFKDVNGQEVESVKLRTNEYGTANGVFTAPSGGLLGRMQLHSTVGDTRHGFSVEEYKRPKFEVKLNELSGSPQLGDTVQVEGKAMAYAGNSISNSEVSYRVVREVRFPWWPWWRSMPSSGSRQEMVSGTTRTDADGGFAFDFVAIPDESVSREQRPQFTYSIYVDVTDQNGETRSANRSVNLAYLSVKAELSLADAVDKAEGNLPVSVITQNLDGQPLPKSVEVSVHLIDAPDRYLRKRYWSVPDYFALDAAAFAQQFPQYAYDHKPEPQFWPLAEEKVTYIINTGEQDSLSLNVEDWPVGHYRVRMEVEDDNGETIEVNKFFMVYDAAAEQLPATVLEWVRLDKTTPYQVGEDLDAHFATGQKEPLPFLLEREHQPSLEVQSWITAAPWHTHLYKLDETDRGGFYFHFSGMRYNRAYTHSVRVNVPWREKELQITYGTFRDKLKPGQEETWELTVSGSDKDKVAAEMVATLYDASLDAFRSHNYQMSLYPNYYSRHTWRIAGFEAESGYSLNRMMGMGVPARAYRALNWFGWNDYNYYGGRVLQRSMAAPTEPMMAQDMAVGMAEPEADSAESAKMAPSSYTGVLEEAAEEESAAESSVPAPPAVRRNLNETVFFYPELRTDEEGNIRISFTMNEALTRWKFMAFAHTAALQYGISEREVVTQKELMVQPNAPRFVRQGDRLTFPAKVSNLTESAMSGTARLQLFDALSMEPIDKQLGNTQPEQSFSVEGGQSTGVYWDIDIPDDRSMAIIHRVTVQAGNFTDGEEAALPVLTNRKLVTETLPLPVKGKESKTFTFKAMDKAKQSKTLQHHNFTLEFTSNPAWYAVKALPYLMEYPHDCSEQIFSRYYANSLATSVANQHPELKRVFEQWRNTDALLSELSKNEELKNILLQQTPWVVDAQNEEAQRKRIGLLFDLNRMAQEQRTAMRQLKERQSGEGGFSWFPGGRDSWYITQYILEGMSRLRDLGVQDLDENPDARYMMRLAAQFVDSEILRYYNRLSEEQKEAGVLPNIAIHYLYTRSLTADMPVEKASRPAFDYFMKEAKDQWLKRNLYEQGMLAVTFQRQGAAAMAETVVNSLRERALNDEEQGMYWKYNTGFYWYQAPIETHAMMIEVFATVAKDEEAVEQLKIWLLKNKQTNHWKTTKATANAVYALLQFGDNWLEETQLASVSFPDLPKAAYTSSIKEAQEAAEAGTGYFKTSWDASAVNHDFSTIKVQNPNASIAWGAAYWQYFENLDKIERFEDTPLTLNKQLYREVMGDQGPILELVTSETALSPGDKLVSRIELRVDRDMEYVHLRDMRASGLEPTNVLSNYKYQDGLGYYESTRDASTDFFFGHLPKGTYVFEYDLRVVHRGTFTNGIAEIQCMYAPEFSSHSAGVGVQVGGE
jgi:uncharacterized protein YfaS (alpha-2-macroglobulin family)